MKKILIGGALGLLLFNVLFLAVSYKGKELPPVKNEETKKGIDSLLVGRGGVLVSLKFSPTSLNRFITLLKEVKLKVAFKEGELSGQSPKGKLIGKRLILKDFKGEICGGEVESDRILINLSSPLEVTFENFSIKTKKRGIRGISTSKLNLEEVCRFIKRGKRPKFKPGNIINR